MAAGSNRSCRARRRGPAPSRRARARRRRRAWQACRRSPARSGRGSVGFGFRLLLPRSPATTPACGKGCGTGFCRSPPLGVVLRPQLHDRGQVGLPAEMEGTTQADQFIPAGLAALGIEADEVDLAVIGAVHQLLWPPIVELLAFDTAGLEPERCPDLSNCLLYTSDAADDLL